MRSSVRVLALLPAFVLLLPRPGLPQVEANPAGHEHAGFYTVAEYDDTRDPGVDLRASVDRAQAEGKRILLEVGGTWCGWCKLLDAFIHDHSAVSERLEAGFLIMKVNWSRENRNEGFLGQYPTIYGYPHIFVLEKDGTLLHSQDTVELEEGKSYNEAVLLAFLDRWMPSTRGGETG